MRNRYIFLTSDFYNDYSSCLEIEQKPTRPYIRIQIEINGVIWALPLRSNIKHPNVIWTDKANNRGIDLSKAVVVSDTAKYISPVSPHLRPNEFDTLKKINDSWIVNRFKQYIALYKKAKAHPEVSRNNKILAYSTLRCFESYI